VCVVCRSELSIFVKSKADFIAKLSIVEEEANESMYWVELVRELTAVESTELRRLLDEANQLTSIVVKSKKTAKAHAG
jgi:four helix bundle protein